MFAVVCFFCLATPGQALAQSQYVIIELPNLIGPEGGVIPNAVNSLGDVVGLFRVRPVTSLEDHAFLYHNGMMIDLNPSGGSHSAAYGINRHLAIVGGTAIPSSPYTVNHAFLYRDGVMLDIFGPEPTGEAVARGINDAGLIVGQFLPGLSGLGFVYDSANGTTTRLDRNLSAYAINNAGDIVGYAIFGSSSHAFLLARDGSLIDIRPYSAAKAVNRWQHVVGNYLNSAGVHHAFLYMSGSLIDIDAFDSGFSTANGISDGDIVVGSYGVSPNRLAFRYSAGVTIRLDTLLPPGSGWTLQDARAINNAGQIVGTGIHSGVPAGFLMTPVQAIYTINDEVLRRLIAGHIGPVGQSFLYTLHQFGEAIHQNNLTEACIQLDIFNADLKKEIGTGISAKDAAELFDRTERMSSWLGCRLPSQ